CAREAKSSGWSPLGMGDYALDSW
nr:immunoglobulin heavy chain junction region [Macaca mulatta]